MPPFPHLFLLLILNIFLVSSKNSSSIAPSDYQALKAIKHELLDSRGFLRTWNESSLVNPCSFWAGIRCLNNHVVSIQLPWRGLGGRISDQLGELQSLRRLSLHDNLLTGPIPASLLLLRNLRALYLFNNRISGSIPPSIGNCLNLQSLDLSNNRINGSVPSGISSLTRIYRINLSRNLIVGNVPYELGNLSKLVFLGLSENHLEGEIPISVANLQNLSVFDVSYNNLSGSVPVLLTEKFNSSSFLGNVHLCGYSNSTKCSSPSPSPSPSPQLTLQRNHTSRKLSAKDIILIASGSLLVVLLSVCCVLLCCVFRRKKSSSEAKSGNTKAVPAVVGGEVESGSETGGRLVHFDGSFVFTADDLLSATAEVMGKSTYGTSYKATLEDGRSDNRNEVAVKRLKEKTSKARKEFEIEIARLGEIRHPNILALRAYYLGPKGEKLLVYDYMSNGSLASFFHARGPETVIPWSTRLKVIIGTTRGLCYLHEHENTVHGNLTSTNILLDEEINPKIGDVGLYRLMMDSANTDTLGYQAPEVMEVTKLKNATVKSDVYSLGVVILEVLTGKSPSEAEEGCDLPRWVAENVEQWSSEVFDVELMRDVCGGDELMKVLRLGLCCVDPLPAARPEAKEVLEKLEEIENGTAGVSGDVPEIEGKQV